MGHLQNFTLTIQNLHHTLENAKGEHPRPLICNTYHEPWVITLEFHGNMGHNHIIVYITYINKGKKVQNLMLYTNITFSNSMLLFFFSYIPAWIVSQWNSSIPCTSRSILYASISISSGAGKPHYSRGFLFGIMLGIHNTDDVRQGWFILTNMSQLFFLQKQQSAAFELLVNCYTNLQIWRNHILLITFLHFVWLLPCNHAVLLEL